ncbi:mitochondrial inner membrane protease ATP23 homolog isoform X2 [Pantherophis guttatus]|uniref:Mitochondrial inner membrane protease ATP23 n=1 Tax=Pantherophis guttatus TaxID=94885 RepID=A0ABM3ZC51_PANGU|nr:mitochondrial inner membrane protease ATP23 homolog isoform X2 [Pantherophis guttatus]XP_060550680.1 mitochondrial inner membrane protease ATP23 homolog isoform X2 [Pantherophis guttatus]
MTSEQTSQPESRDSGEEQEDDFGYSRFPERTLGQGKKPALKGKIISSLFGSQYRCQSMLKIALDSPQAKLLLEAMKNSGCAVTNNRHISCENCDKHVGGGFDSSVSQIVLCQNNIHSQSQMNRVVAHELIHAFDHCRAHVDWFNNIKHLACSETCVKMKAVRSMLAVRNITKEMAEKAVDEVFESCFNDHEPFDRVPHSKLDAKYAYRGFQNRHRYYQNL